MTLSTCHPETLMQWLLHLLVLVWHCPSWHAHHAIGMRVDHGGSRRRHQTQTTLLVRHGHNTPDISQVEVEDGDEAETP
jgi:hypothetical protein